jgi:O-antigen chain-terminating methyltransferase
VPTLEETLQRLAKERDEADRRYNEALTALDRAAATRLDTPDPAPAFDDHQIAALNGAWNILPEPPVATGVRGKLTGLVWGIVAPYFQRQLTFNSWLVDHLNRNLAAAREAHSAALEDAEAVRAHSGALIEFQARLIQYLQHVTLYVDTRDRAAGSGALVLNAAISSVAEGLDKRAETAAAQYARIEARLDTLAATDESLRAALSVVQQASLVLKREVGRLATSPAPATPAASASPPAPLPTSDGQAFAPALDAYKYLAFEDRFRGSRDEIRTRMTTYLPFFEGASEVLDVGCGRGEFLELMAGAGISARGLDLNHEMVETCKARGLDVTEADAVSYLSSLPDGSLGGLFAAQVVEHLQPAYLLAFLELAFHKLRPGGRLILETLNPSCWIAFFESYIRDVTHVWPLHPETLQFLVVASGFTTVDIEYRSPIAEADKLQPVTATASMGPVLADLVDSFNANVDKLNSRIYTFLDYAVIGTR